MPGREEVDELLIYILTLLGVSACLLREGVRGFVLLSDLLWDGVCDLVLTPDLTESPFLLYSRPRLGISCVGDSPRIYIRTLLGVLAYLL